MRAILSPHSGLGERLAALYEMDPGPRRVRAMEGLRGVAILLVFVCHYKIIVLTHFGAAFNTRSAGLLVQIGGTGVDLFFLLSGMLVYRAALRQDLHIGRFLLRRLQRIYPPFLAAFALYFTASSVLHEGAQRVPGTVTRAAVYLGSNMLLLPGVVDMQPLIPAAWSLSYELCFYLVIPLIVMPLRMYQWSRARRCSFWFSLLIIHVLYVLLLPKTLPVYHFQSNTFLRFDMFLAGMLVFEVLSSVRGAVWLTHKARMLLTSVGLVASLCYCVFVYRTLDTPNAPTYYAVLGMTLVLVTYTTLTLATMGQSGFLNRALSFTWLRWMGNISYSFYLIHGIALNALLVVLLRASPARAHPMVAAAVFFPISFAFTFAIATMFYVAIEKPLSLQNKPRASSSNTKAIEVF